VAGGPSTCGCVEWIPIGIAGKDEWTIRYGNFSITSFAAIVTDLSGRRGRKSLEQLRLIAISFALPLTDVIVTALVDSPLPSLLLLLLLPLPTSFVRNGLVLEEDTHSSTTARWMGGRHGGAPILSIVASLRRQSSGDSSGR